MKKILTAVLMSASLTSVCGQALPVNAMDSMPDAFVEEANRILSKGFCDEVKETGDKLLIPGDYMYENFDDVMYKLVGLEMDYLDSVPYEMWDEMVAETTEEIMNRCRNILPYGSIVGKWKCSIEYGDEAEADGTFSYGADGQIASQMVFTIINPEDGRRAVISTKVEGDYEVGLGEYYYTRTTLQRAEGYDLSRNQSDFSKEMLSKFNDTANSRLIGQLQEDSFTLFLANRFEQEELKCVREE